MYHLIKITGLIILTLFLYGCEKNEISYNIDEIIQETGEYSINGEKLSVNGDSEGIINLNSDLAIEIDNWREDFITRVSSVQNKGEELPSLQFKHIVTLNENGIFSFITEKFTYISGLHGNTWRTAKTYSVQENKVLKLCDLFVDDKYPEILNRRIEKIVEENKDEYHDLWEKPIVDEKREDKFYLDGKNLVIFYEPYELSYYARGVVEFPISTEEIRGYIKECYLAGG